MSVEEIKSRIASLSAGEQSELTAFLFHLRHASDADYRATIEARMTDTDRTIG